MIGIVGRPNVGKSTLFNRLAGWHAAVVDDRPGVTRDRLFAGAKLGEREVILVDTGGFEPNAKDELILGAVQQARLAVAEADVVLFLVDAKDGPHPLDQEVAALLRKSGKPILGVINKSDPGSRYSLNDWEFSRFGFEMLPLSAVHGTGISELVERIQSMLPPVEEDSEEPLSTPARFRLCLVGRPNVGKSSLANRLAGTERQLVNPVPGTTRDAVDIPIERGELRCVLVDTPGVRRKSRIVEKLEHYSVLAALRSLERADVAVVVLDGCEPFSDQDARLLRMAQERGRGIVVVVNKTDLWSAEARRNYLRDLKFGMRFAEYAPRLTVSARTGTGVDAILSEASRVLQSTLTRIPTADLNRFVEEATGRLDPPMIRGKRGKIYYITQVDVGPPTFVGWVNDPGRITVSYRRYLERRLRQRFPFPGAPLRWIFRPRGAERQGDGRKRRGRK